MTLVPLDRRESASRIMDDVFDHSYTVRKHPLVDDVFYSARLCSRVHERRHCIVFVGPYLDQPRPHQPIRERELHGNAADTVKDAFPSLVGLPDDGIPIGEEIEIWGHRWIVRPSSLGPDIGLGLFACEDVIVPPDCALEDRPELFPFYGPIYSAHHWLVLSRACPTFGAYGLKVDLIPGRAFMDGYPPCTRNLAGYINNTKGFRRGGCEPNVEWVECTRPHPRIHHRLRQYAITHATRTIRVGDEILRDYDYHRR